MPRLCRSALFVPGANERALAKSLVLPADVLIYDLEDSVAPDAKRQARQSACSALAQGGRVREIAVRINAPGTAWYADDLPAAASAHPRAIVVPKVSSAEDVLRIERDLDQFPTSPGTELWVMLETPAAVLQSLAIANSSPRLTVLIMGTNDLTKELRAEQVAGRQPLLFALSACLAAARSAGKEILDGVYNDVRDVAGLEAECRQARQLGFDGKTLIHPSQIEPCNRIFAPSDNDLARARATIQAYEAALERGLGVATVDGRLIERLHVDQARRILDLAEKIAHSNSMIG